MDIFLIVILFSSKFFIAANLDRYLVRWRFEPFWSSAGSYNSHDYFRNQHFVKFSDKVYKNNFGSSVQPSEPSQFGIAVCHFLDQFDHIYNGGGIFDHGKNQGPFGVEPISQSLDGLHFLLHLPIRFSHYTICLLFHLK